MATSCRQKIGSARHGCYLLPVLLLLSIVPLAGQENKATSGSLHGTVRDVRGASVADASISLKHANSKENTTAATDSQGNYLLTGLPEGVYSLHVSKTGVGERGLASLFLTSGENKSMDVILEPSSASETALPQFFDQPQFTVSGVTDTTSLGGHGSDTIVRTRESIAKETASLGKPSAQPAIASAALENSLRESLKHDPESFDANHRLGRLLVETGRPGSAIPYLERAARASPTDYGTACDLALANADAGNYAQARDDARKLLEIQDKAEGHHLLGDAEEKLGNSLEAVHQYQRAAEMDPSEPYLFDWGSELLLHHAPEPAEEVFTNGHRRFPRSVRMLIGLGAASFARGSYEQAVQRLCEASDLDPNNPAPYLFLGKMQSADKIPSAELVEKLHRFATLQPQNAQANYYYAVALWKEGRNAQNKAQVSQIEDLLASAIRLDPKFAPAELQLGILKSEQGDYAAAISHFNRAAQIDPQLEETHYRLSQAYREVKQTDKAKEELRIYQEFSKKSSEQVQREHHEIQQFVYTLRDQPTRQTP